MKKTISILSLLILANASTNNIEKIIKQEFNKNILPVIIKNLENNKSYSIILKFNYTENKQIKISSYTPTPLYSNLIKLDKKGNYNIGYKYYAKYIIKTSKIKVTDFVKIIEAKSNKDLDKLFQNNAKLLLKKLKDEKQFYAIKGMIQIIKRNKLNDLKEFLKGVLAGKIPASCS